ncbi:pyrroline-5-carboxylate reductase [Malacoplasma iowae]|uniref:Pyrroline-5-carboxylate reductase n=1 Tax=Malacoplasma iowae 695 TaxID=1048830 RepID=A0A6P1LD97_MALIO|nr:pyrroline-5-carboxylate reductase [Malacoplasma iowae]VEU61681.1 Pyrroline-5-carboxylate reductase [Mycoplasmopsis fermentans]EGZ31003.1 pyrroline-5-carboxylate reductase [Malacoplasma iowae 695]QHG90177.1 pyrroline-5-carboxylate reductase [Malacoplasma iowae 695]WPL36074.1 pyrroline-5-carboxylate reductase [Malacoplasma iowae]VEU71187.1 Pyrroline-5-carboxylate reductase [Malacoplasma iowae]
MKIKIGFIGMGNMGSLLLKQMKLLDNNLIKFCIFDRNQHKLEQNCSGYNVIVCNSELELIQKSHIIFLCVKPNEYDDLLIKIKNFNPNIIVVNITIGYPLKRMIEILGNENSKVVRVMPSTTMVTKKSVIGWTYKNLTPKQIKLFNYLFKYCGNLYELSEKEIDIVSVISGSLPAFIFKFIESASDGSVYCGLNREKSYQIIAKTMISSAQLVLDKIASTTELKNQVTSPNGSTIHGILELEKNNFSFAIMNSIIKTYEKTQKN